MLQHAVRLPDNIFYSSEHFYFKVGVFVLRYG